jgi:hypothetical protein
MSVDTPARNKVAGRRAGYAVAAAIDAVLLYLVNVRPGWAAVPFLTEDMTYVLTLLNVSFWLGLVANVLYLVHPAPWLVAAGGIATTGVGVAVLARIWQFFPFDFGSASGWAVVVRILLVVAIVGSVIGVITQIVTLVRAAGGSRSPS